MNGPEHYKAAEHVLETLDEEILSTDDEDMDPEMIMMFLAQAQVHATLALAAATALAVPERSLVSNSAAEVVQQWVDVTTAE